MTFCIQKILSNALKKKKILELVNEFKVSGYRVNIKNKLFLNSSSEQSEMKLRNNSIYNTIKKNKILRNKFDNRGATHVL